jgi:flagellar biosynthesis protein FliP
VIRIIGTLLLGLLAQMPIAAVAAPAIEAVTVTTAADGSQNYGLSLQILILMTLLTFLPAAVMMMTSFTRIIIVLAILRQAIGLMQAPSAQVLVGLSLFLTIFIMSPVLDRIHDDALRPYLDDQITLQVALERSRQPVHAFMLRHTREADLAMFASLAGYESGFESPEAVPLTVLIPSFVTSELKTAFQIGFIIFIPFLIIDLVVASVLMSMGMMMLSPMIISLPFKIMLFVLVDGWALIMSTLAASFDV